MIMMWFNDVVQVYVWLECNLSLDFLLVTKGDFSCKTHEIKQMKIDLSYESNLVNWFEWSHPTKIQGKIAGFVFQWFSVSHSLSWALFKFLVRRFTVFILAEIPDLKKLF